MRNGWASKNPTLDTIRLQPMHYTEVFVFKHVLENSGFYDWIDED